MHCVIDTSVRGCGRLHVDQEAADVFTAIDRAAERIKTTVRRKINRHRDRKLRGKLND